MRIWKFELAITDLQTVLMPKGAKLLDVQVQNERCCLWALCDENAPKVERRIAIYGTGYQVLGDTLEYIGTFQMQGGSLVFHAFEIC